MYGGETGKVVLRCDNSILDHVIDRFGAEIGIMKNPDGKTFDAAVTGSLTGIAYWASGYIDSCEVISPASVRSRVTDMIKNNKYGL